MKKVLLIAAAVALMASPAFALIANSAHDFTSLYASTTEICVYCHTPHNADLSVTDAPLWNHTLTTASYTVYSSSTLDATVGQPSGISKLCLSCHDDSVALDAYGTNAGTTTISVAKPGTTANIGGDADKLANDHPVGFLYDTGLATSDGGLFDPATKTTALGGTISADLLFSGQLECASCHDVHNGAGNASLLRIANGGSALCLTCHNK